MFPSLNIDINNWLKTINTHTAMTKDGKGNVTVVLYMMGITQVKLVTKPLSKNTTATQKNSLPIIYIHYNHYKYSNPELMT